MYDIERGSFCTPRGQAVNLLYRKDSSDWNTLYSCLNEDEYRLKDLRLEGTALDIGAHIGGVSIGLAVDNPGLAVIAVEAVPPNVELLRQNIELNGVSDRVTVLAAAAGKGGTATIRWGFEGDETADHHAFIGNSGMAGLTKHQPLQVKSLSLRQIIKDQPIAFCKIDCEGCEYEVLRGPALKQVALIRGEIHGIRGINPLQLVEALVPTHIYEQQSDALPTGFEAVLR